MPVKGVPNLTDAENHVPGKRRAYLVTPWCRFLLEKLTGLQLVKKFPAFYGTRRFIIALTSFRHLSLSCALQRKHPACKYFLTWMFYREGLLATRPNHKLEDHPLSAVHDCLFNLFVATLHNGGRSSIRNLRRRHAVVTGTHYMVLRMLRFVMCLRRTEKVKE